MALPAQQLPNAATAKHEDEHSASAAFEQLVEGAHGILSKRIDLALLEAREFVSGTLERAAWGIACIVMLAATWLSLSMSLAYVILPNAVPARRLAIFALINGIAALGALAYASRSKRLASRTTRVAPTDARSVPKSGRDRHPLEESR